MPVLWVTDISSQINCIPLRIAVLSCITLICPSIYKPCMWWGLYKYSLKIIIEFSFLLDSSLELFLLIHNLDSQMLRGDKSQQIIGQLSSLRNIYLIASIDHLNAPLSKLNVTVFSSWDNSLWKLLFLMLLSHSICIVFTYTFPLFHVLKTQLTKL